MPAITMHIPLNQVKAVEGILDEKGNLASNLTVPFKRMGVYLQRQTDRTFRERGRPAGSWEPLSDYTLSLRKHRGKRYDPNLILVDAGTLKNSFTTQVQPRGMKFGTTVRYADIHQRGGTRTRPQVVISAKNAKALKFQIGGTVLFRKSVVLPAKQFTIPKRPILTWLPHDADELERLVTEHLSKGKN